MTAISRRTILGGIAATAGGVVASAIPLPAPAAIIEQPMSPEERLQAAVEELKVAAVAVYPELSSWRICLDKTQTQDCPVIIAGFRPF